MRFGKCRFATIATLVLIGFGGMAGCSSAPGEGSCYSLDSGGAWIFCQQGLTETECTDTWASMNPLWEENGVCSSLP